MRTLLLTASLVLALGLISLLIAGEAQAAPIGGAKLSIAPDVVVGFGCGCPPPPRRVVVVRRRVAPAPVVVRRVYVPRYYAPAYGPYYPSYGAYYPSYGAGLHLGFGYSHGYSRGYGYGHGYSHGYSRGHGTTRVVGRRR